MTDIAPQTHYPQYPAYYYYHDYDRYSGKGHLLSQIQRIRRIIRQRWWVMAAGLGLAIAALLAYLLLTPPKYLSVGRMIVNVKLTIPEGSVYAEELANFLGTQAALMQSPTVLTRAQTRVALQNPEFRNPEKVSIKVTVLPKTSMFVLEAIGSSPRYTQAFLQACMEEYINLKRDIRSKTSDITLAGLTEEVLRLERELRQNEEELAAFLRSNSIVVLQEQGNAIGSYLAQLNQRIAVLKSEYDLLSSLVNENSPADALFADNSALLSDQLVGARTLRAEDSLSAGYLRAKQQLLLLKAEQADLAQYLRPKHPKMIALAEEINRRERLLEIFRQQGIEQIESRRNSLHFQLQNLQHEAEEWNAKALEVNWKMAEYQRIKGNIQRIQALYDRLLATMQTLDVNKEITPESVTILEDASPAESARPGLLKLLALAGLAGLALGGLMILILEQIDDKIRSYSELTQLFTEPTLAQIPKHKIHKSRSGTSELIEPGDQRHTFVEAYRNLRSSIIYMTQQNNAIRRILITSSVPNEGKSVTAANLAITIAMAESKVLLVDADLRKGRLHDAFGIPAAPGLSEMLTNTLTLDNVVYQTKYPNLHLIPRGTPTLKASELFLGPHCNAFLAEIAHMYDFIVFDSVPVLVSDDVTSLAPKLDGVIFVVRAEVSSARIARAALDQLYARNAKILGLVLNGVRPTTNDYHYQYHKYKNYYRLPETKQGPAIPTKKS